MSEGDDEVAIGLDGFKAKGFFSKLFPKRAAKALMFQELAASASAKIVAGKPLQEWEALVVHDIFGRELSKRENLVAVCEYADSAEVEQLALEDLRLRNLEAERDAAVGEDWLTRFVRAVETAVSPRVRTLLARVLKGEFMAPGAYSVRTVLAILELDEEVEHAFRALASCVFVDGLENYVVPAFETLDGYSPLGLDIHDLQLLGEVGLVGLNVQTSYIPIYEELDVVQDVDGMAFVSVQCWPPRTAIALAADIGGKRLELDVQLLTRTGVQLLPLLAAEVETDVAELASWLGRELDATAYVSHDNGSWAALGD